MKSYYDQQQEEDRRLLDLWIKQAEPAPKKADTLIPICPCCGYGKTLFVHIQKETALVISSDFTNWCISCRRKIALQFDKHKLP